MLSAKSWSFCLGFNVLIIYVCVSSFSAWPFCHPLLAETLENIPQLALLSMEIIGKVHYEYRSLG